jgi:hypothetical protein
MKLQDVKIAARMGSRFEDALHDIQAGKIPKTMLAKFPSEHLEEICDRVGLRHESGEELLAVAMALAAELAESANRQPEPKPSELRNEIDAIRTTAQTLKTQLINASAAARDACTVCTHAENGDGSYVLEFSEEPFEAALAPLSKLIEHLDNPNLPAGESGPPISPKRHALGVLMHILTEATGKCTKEQLQWLAEHVLEPVLPDDDTTRWRELIPTILAEQNANSALRG